MKLFGKDVTPEKVMTYVAERLEARGLVKPGDLDVARAGVEPRVDPLTFSLSALEENADATRGLPLETHRDGLGGRAVLLAKKMFRAAGQVFINEALGRQRVFNGHVRDSYAQLASEVLRLRQRVAELETRAAEAPKAVAAGPGERARALPAARKPSPAKAPTTSPKRAPRLPRKPAGATKPPEAKGLRAAVAGEARPVKLKPAAKLATKARAARRAR